MEKEIARKSELRKEINLALAVLKEKCQDLTSIMPWDQMRVIRSIDHIAITKREAVADLIDDIYERYDLLEKSLSSYLSYHSASYSDLSIESGISYTKFLNEELLPNIDIVKRLWEMAIDWEPDEIESPAAKEQIRDTLLEALALLEKKIEEEGKRLEDQAQTTSLTEQDEIREWYAKSENFLEQLRISSVRRVVEEDIFQPDSWEQNRKELRPILLEKPRRVPSPVRVRLREVYRSFIFDNWISVFAISRAILEYCIKDRASRLDIEVQSPDDHGKQRDKRLSWLIDDLIEKRPELETLCDFIKDHGNSYLHPKKGEDRFLFREQSRQHALECVGTIKTLVEKLYSDETSPIGDVSTSDK